MKSIKEHFDKRGIYYVLPASMLFLFILYKSVFGLRLDSGNKINEQHGYVYSPNNLPSVLANNNSDLIRGRLKQEAVLQFAKHRLPENLEQWEIYRAGLKDKIIQNTGFIHPNNLPLDIREAGLLRMENYDIKIISFQTLPGIHATANLFVPHGDGPFPAVIHMLGHWNEGKIAPFPQSVGHSLALNGYVVLTIDPWGAGERATIHGQYEYHGANLGASFLNLGESLMGIHISENMRGIDLLESLPYVDAGRIGATGASGGGNQTMWLAAVDERVKAAVPVVSVGTFESYIMGSNCICETMVDGLVFTEEAGILAMVAPRALAIYNGEREANAAFLPSEMLRSYRNAKPIFDLYGVGDHLSNQVFDLDHGYHPEMREAMVGWFDLHLKGTGSGLPIGEKSFKLVDPEKLMVFPSGKRDGKVLTTTDYCRIRGQELRKDFMGKANFNVRAKKEELNAIIRLHEKPVLKGVHSFGNVDGWDLFALEIVGEKLVPILHRSPDRNSKNYVIISHPEGKEHIAPDVISEWISTGKGVVVVDLYGTGEVRSSTSTQQDRIAKLHTLSRAELWLGRRMLGEWAKELGMVVEFLNSRYRAKQIVLDGTMEAGLAGLLLSTIENKTISEVVLRKAPVSYKFDAQEGIDFFSMAIHLPGILQWGDISLMAALSGKDVTFIDPVTMSGNRLREESLEPWLTEFDKVRQMSRQAGRTVFVYSD